MTDEKDPRFQKSDDGAEPDFRAKEVTIAPRGKFGRVLENLWYHYKFQIVAGVVLLTVLIVCLVQCVGRGTNPDYILCYAGRKDLHPTASNTAQADMASSLTGFLTEQSLTGEGVEIYPYLITDGSTDMAVQSYNKTNLENLRNELALANTYLFFLDESLFLTQTKTGEERYLVSVDAYLTAGKTPEVTPDGYGVYLRSLSLSTLPGFCELPDDTVVCLRVGYTLGGGKSAERKFARYEALFRALLANPL